MTLRPLRPVPDAALAAERLWAATTRHGVGLEPGADDPSVAASFRLYGACPERAWVYRFEGPIVVEAGAGHALRGDGVLRPALPYSERHPPPERHQLDLANPLELGAVVTLRDLGEANHYHLFVDVLGRLAVLGRLGLDDPELALLVGRALWERPFFAALVTSTPLRERRFVVHDRPVLAASVLAVKAPPHDRGGFDLAADALGAVGDPAGERRVFLDRDPARGRALANGRSVAERCATLGFERVDADRLDLAGQVALFRSTRFVVGVHGAGLAGLAFRRGAPLGLLELFPPTSAPAQYRWLCAAYGFEHRSLRGAPDPGGDPQRFTVVPDRLDAALAALVGGAAPTPSPGRAWSGPRIPRPG